MHSCFWFGGPHDDDDADNGNDGDDADADDEEAVLLRTVLFFDTRQSLNGEDALMLLRLALFHDTKRPFIPDALGGTGGGGGDEDDDAACSVGSLLSSLLSSIVWRYWPVCLNSPTKLLLDDRIIFIALSRPI